MVHLQRISQAMTQEDADTKTTLAALERRLREIEQQRASGGTGAIPMPQPDPTGAEQGIKPDDPGSASHPQAVQLWPYLGLGASTKGLKLLVVSFIGVESIVEFRGSAFWPEAAGQRTQLTIGKETLTVKAHQSNIPTQAVLHRYLGLSTNHWLGILNCGKGVYAATHPDQDFYVNSATLLLARLEYLKETVHYLEVSGYSWSGSWRYLILLWERRMRNLGYLHNLPFDRDLLSCYRSPMRQLAVAQLASTTILLPELLRSEAAAAAAAEQEAPAQRFSLGAPPVAAARKPAHGAMGDVCALCGASGHTYRAPDYACTAAVQNPLPHALGGRPAVRDAARSLRAPQEPLPGRPGAGEEAQGCG